MLTLFTFGETEMGLVLGYATDIVGDFMPLLMLIIGLCLGFFVLKAIFNLK